MPSANPKHPGMHPFLNGVTTPVASAPPKIPKLPTQVCSNPPCEVMRRDKKLKKCSRCDQNGAPQPAYYCSSECQGVDWREHKKTCKVKKGAPAAPSSSSNSSNLPAETPAGTANKLRGTHWFDQHRRGKDGTAHYGHLELITWNGEDTTYDEETGNKKQVVRVYWGREGSERAGEALKRKFEKDYGSNPASFFTAQGGAFDCSFRWTCCGLSGSQGSNGCDHHGVRYIDEEDLGRPWAKKGAKAGEFQADFPCKCDFCMAGKPQPSHLHPKKRLLQQTCEGISVGNGPDPRSKSEAGLKNFAMRELFMGKGGGGGGMGDMQNLAALMKGMNGGLGAEGDVEKLMQMQAMMGRGPGGEGKPECPTM